MIATNAPRRAARSGRGDNPPASPADTPGTPTVEPTPPSKASLEGESGYGEFVPAWAAEKWAELHQGTRDYDSAVSEALALLGRTPEPVTDDGGYTSSSSSRNGGESCQGCHGERLSHRGDPWSLHRGRHRWAGYCWPCARDAENARRRDLRRQARANRSCGSCARPFTGSRSDAVYCSNACRQKAYRQRGGVS